MAYEDLIEQARAQIEAANTTAALQEVRVAYLGKKGKVTLLSKRSVKFPGKSGPRTGSR